MRITPRTETEAKAAELSRLLKPAWYDAQILEGDERPDKTGNDMIELLLSISGKAGAVHQIKDWLTDKALGAVRLRHACQAAGLLAAYEAGSINAADFVGHSVCVRVTVKKSRGYGLQNAIEDYRATASTVVPLRQTG